MHSFTTSRTVRRSSVAPFFFFLAMMLVAATSVSAAPFRPAGDDQVLLEIPAAERLSRATLARLRAAFDVEPANADAAVSLAGAYLDLHRKLGDPRFLGYAESVLNTFGAATSSPPSAAMRLLRADLMQSRHHFDDAGTELFLLLEEDPTQWSAWLMLASIAETQGDYDLARKACARLIFAGQDLVALTCASSIASLQGRSQVALAQLQKALAGSDRIDAATAAWGHVVAAEIALRLEDYDGAEMMLNRAINLDDGLYTRVALADVLINRGRYQDANAVLSGAPATDAVLIRQAQVHANTNGDERHSLMAQVQRRIDAMHMRGDLTHGREEALFAISVKQDAELAIEAALRNWQLQRESIDAQLLLEAALAAGQAEAAEPVLRWMDANDSDDRRLLRLRRQIERSRS